MITAIAKRSVLLRQDELGNGKKKDVMTKKGEKMQITEREAIEFYGAFSFDEKTSKSLLSLSKNQGIKRRI
jgi:hypothetical protein